MELRAPNAGAVSRGHVPAVVVDEEVDVVEDVVGVVGAVGVVGVVAVVPAVARVDDLVDGLVVAIVTTGVRVEAVDCSAVACRPVVELAAMDEAEADDAVWPWEADVALVTSVNVVVGGNVGIWLQALSMSLHRSGHKGG